MTSLFTNLSTVPALIDVESDACGFPFPTCHIWQPRVWLLIVIVAVPHGGAVDVITSATRAARPTVARRRVLFVSMIPPFERSAQCRPRLAGRHPRGASIGVRVSRNAVASGCGCGTRRERPSSVHAPTKLRGLVERG